MLFCGRGHGDSDRAEPGGAEGVAKVASRRNTDMRTILALLEIALAHLVKAGEKLEHEPWSGAAYKAHAEIIYATKAARHALELLRQEEKE